MTEADRAQAIADMESARQTHADWVSFLEHPEVDERALRPQEEVAGSADHHREWIEKYDRVLRLLRPNVTDAAERTAAS